MLRTIVLQPGKLFIQARQLFIRARDLGISVHEPFVRARGQGIVGFSCFGGRRGIHWSSFRPISPEGGGRICIRSRLAAKHAMRF